METMQSQVSIFAIQSSCEAYSKFKKVYCLPDKVTILKFTYSRGILVNKCTHYINRISAEVPGPLKVQRGGGGGAKFDPLRVFANLGPKYAYYTSFERLFDNFSKFLTQNNFLPETKILPQNFRKF